MFKSLIRSCVCVLALGFSVPASAEVFYWQDHKTGVSASFPDRWDFVTNVDPNDVLTVYAPGEGHMATCRVNAKNDARFAIYPRHYAGQIQRLYVSDEMWERYYAYADNPVFHSRVDDVGLSHGFASMAQVSFETVDGPKALKRGIAFASLYGNILYTVECSAEASVYHLWHDAFLSFIKSVDFKKHTNHALSGYYRDFLKDKVIKVRGQTVLDDSYL